MGTSPGEWNGNPLQYSCPENPVDRGVWRATVHGVAQSHTRLSNFISLSSTLQFHLRSSGIQFSSVQLLSRVQLFVIPWTAAHQASLSFTISLSSLRLMSIESVMPFNHLILCCPLLLLPSTFPMIRAFSNELPLHIRWPKYWSFNFSVSPSNEYSGLISFRMDCWISLQSKALESIRH